MACLLHHHTAGSVNLDVVSACHSHAVLPPDDLNQCAMCRRLCTGAAAALLLPCYTFPSGKENTDGNTLKMHFADFLQTFHHDESFSSIIIMK